MQNTTLHYNEPKFKNDRILLIYIQYTCSKNCLIVPDNLYNHYDVHVDMKNVLVLIRIYLCNCYSMFLLLCAKLTNHLNHNKVIFFLIILIEAHN